MNTFWGLVASNAVVAALMGVGVALVGRVWKNAAAVHVLWVVVLLKLFTPPLVIAGLPTALIPSRPAPGAGVAPTGKDPERPGRPDPVRETPITATVTGTSVQAPDREVSPGVAPGKVAGGGPWSLSTWLAAVWFVGSCGTAMVYAASIRRFAGSIGVPGAPSTAIRATVAQLSARLGLVRVPDILMTSRALPPMVWSLGTSPRLILPSGLFSRLGGEAQSTILAHELIHIRRGDHLVRYLELAATTVFWWHPVAWLAGRRLRGLEEQCCDGRVLELLPDRPRTYASAMVDTLEFLSGGPCGRVPLRTAIDPTTSLSRRIQMLTHRRPTRLGASTWALVAGLVAPPLSLAFAFKPEPAPHDAPEAQKPPAAGAPAAVLRGRVTTKVGAPLPGARVRVALPAADMRFVDPSSDHPRQEVKTDANGDYELKFPGVAKGSTASIDAMMPGFRRLAGTLMMGGDVRNVELEPGATAVANIELEPARYFSGIVVDEQGQPIPSVKIGAMMIIGRGTGGVEMTATGPDGSFELFNYFVDPAEKFGAEAGMAFVGFSHPDYIEFRIEDVYAIEPDKRGDLRIVLSTGQKVTGTVVDVAGKPVRNAMVEVVLMLEGQRKAILTDANGRFTLKGLKKGAATLAVVALDIKQKVRQPLAINGDKEGVEVRLQSIALPADLKKHAVLGMQLADVTPELKSAYDLHFDRGALILDPGRDFERLKIGELAEGNLFWMVGHTRVGSVLEFADQLLAETGGRDAEEHSIRLVYSFKTPEFVGTNTQYIKLTRDDVKQLQAVSERLKADPK